MSEDPQNKTPTGKINGASSDENDDLKPNSNKYENPSALDVINSLVNKEDD